MKVVVLRKMKREMIMRMEWRRQRGISEQCEEEIFVKCFGLSCHLCTSRWFHKKYAAEF